MTVSIHAPARGATGPRRAVLGVVEVSIHAPARGATRCPCTATDLGSCFNPRARAGRDTSSYSFLVTSSCFNPRARAGRDASINAPSNDCEVSIHAPARGATRNWIVYSYVLIGFNPRARAGRDKGD